MKKIIISFLLFAIFISLLSGCGNKYDEKDFIGKTSAEIISEYGEFDFMASRADEDDLYRNCRCGYTVKEPKVGFLGTSDEILFFITFDENGVAKKCEEGYRPGG